LQGTEKSHAADLISDTADGVDQRAIETGIYFFPQIIDVNVHDIRDRTGAQFPSLLDYNASWYRLQRALHQKIEQYEFLLRKVNRVAAPSNRAFNAIQLEILNSQDDLRRAANAPQQRSDSRGEFGERQGLRHEIVCAGLHAADAIIGIGAGAEYHNKDIGFCCTNVANHLQPAIPALPQVKNRELIGSAVHPSLCFRHIGSDIHVESVILQALADEVSQQWVTLKE
jgi:hypothetical protein